MDPVSWEIQPGKRLARRSKVRKLAVSVPAAGARQIMRRLFSCVTEGGGRFALLAALFASYFGSLSVGSLHFPHEYDWRRNVISNLLSPRDNPQWYWLPSAGVTLAGLCMLPLTGWIDAQLGDGESKLARRVRRPAFRIGIACLILSAVVAPQHVRTVMGIRHAHEAFARASAAGLGLGMLAACGSAGLEEGRGAKRKLLRMVWRATTVAPIAGAISSGVIVGLSHLHGVGPAGWLRGTLFWRLAFWEWMGSVAVFLFFASSVFMLGDPAANPAHVTDETPKSYHP